ncbi:MAG TPA: hypothetical protein VMG10_04890 [Gemmataceae bacterium]|nr:hypothetical protein [Gemmataceae bacterium]
MEQMPVIQTEIPENLFLDPRNPRLGRHNIEKGITQDEILDVMKNWTLEELAVSFLESGFWPQEALIVVRDTIPGKKGQVLVVVEGNRRLAALKMIAKARAKEKGISDRWIDIIRGYKPADFARLKQIPYILKKSREEVRAYIGYRHVTGIKEWNPAEKAEYIAHLIEHEKLTYEQVRKRIGSKMPTVRQNYISYRLLLQMESKSDRIDVGRVEDRFSVLYLSLRTRGVQTYLEIDIEADPETAKKPVPPGKLKELENFARWLFGSKDQEPIISDSRQVDDFGRILENPSAVEYLERNERPSYSVARRMAGVAESDVSSHVERAADEIEEALKAAHQHKSSKRLEAAVRRVGADAFQLLALFPGIRKELLKQLEDEE